MNEPKQTFESQLLALYEKIKDNLNPIFLNQDDTIKKYLKIIGSQENEFFENLRMIKARENQTHVKGFLGGFLHLMGLCMLGTTSGRQQVKGWRQEDIATLLGISFVTVAKFSNYIREKHGDLLNPELYKPK